MSRIRLFLSNANGRRRQLQAQLGLNSWKSPNGTADAGKQSKTSLDEEKANDGKSSADEKGSTENKEDDKDSHTDSDEKI